MNEIIIQEMFNEICEKKARYHMYTTQLDSEQSAITSLKYSWYTCIVNNAISLEWFWFINEPSPYYSTV